MADVNSQVVRRERRPARPHGDEQTKGLPDPALIALVELLFFAYRDFTREADAVLAEFDLGRAHHRVLHFVNHHPGLRIADLLDILKITKQSLARVLRDLVEHGWIVQQPGERDRRQRLLYASERGAALATRLDGLQARRVAHALAASRLSDTAEVGRFLFAMIAGPERPLVEALLPVPVEPAAID